MDTKKPKSLRIRRTPDLEELIFTGLRENLPLRVACAKAGCTMQAFLGWLSADLFLFEKYVNNRALGAELAIDELLDRLDKALPAEHQLLKIQLDTLKWRIEKIAPRRFGAQTRQHIEVTGQIEIVPVVNVCLNGTVDRRCLPVSNDVIKKRVAGKHAIRLAKHRLTNRGENSDSNPNNVIDVEPISNPINADPKKA